ncbi:hypothetical protein AVEN_77479-1 [Araneus ventricosus]|uniref:Transposase Tc1-like domain-containing protein n=1 Tax=Araneus ventricosus TaxID=182803 RepID=A0A4Y2NHU3_ARAVE|nr:hypothetical protein AVEN_77479-1 [Araneus ventricosus]
MYREYRVSGKTSNFRHRCGRKKDLEKTGPLTSDANLKLDRRTILPQIAADFNDGASTSVSVRTVQRTVINMGSQSRWPTRVPLLTALHKSLLLSWAQQTTIGLLMTGNTLCGLTSLVSNCIGRMHVYEYGDDIINP